VRSALPLSENSPPDVTSREFVNGDNEQAMSKQILDCSFVMAPDVSREGPCYCKRRSTRSEPCIMNSATTSPLRHQKPTRLGCPIHPATT
jgi:hypothetical protein